MSNGVRIGGESVPYLTMALSWVPTRNFERSLQRHDELVQTRPQLASSVAICVARWGVAVTQSV